MSRPNSARDGGFVVVLPEDWGWLPTEPDAIRETVGALLPPQVPTRTRRQIVLQAVDELMALRIGLGAWEPKALAGWIEPAIIDGEETYLAANLLIAVNRSGASTIDDVRAGAGASGLVSHATATDSIDLPYGPAVRVQGLWAPEGAPLSLRAWLYIIPTPELDALALLLFGTRDEEEWEAYGELFDAIASTFAVVSSDPEAR